MLVSTKASTFGVETLPRKKKEGHHGDCVNQMVFWGLTWRRKEVRGVA